MPSSVPSASIQPTSVPSDAPTVSKQPSFAPSGNPTLSLQPTTVPSALPSISTRPTSVPSDMPSISQQPSLSLQPTSPPSPEFGELVLEIPEANLTFNEDESVDLSKLVQYVDRVPREDEAIVVEVSNLSTAAVSNVVASDELVQGGTSFSQTPSLNATSILVMPSLLEMPGLYADHY